MSTHACPSMGGDRGPDRRGLADGDGMAELVAAASPGALGRPEAGVHAHGQLAAGAGAADPGGQLVDEAGGVGPPGKELLGEPVELADVPEGEGAQEGPDPWRGP
jgi:hypothetical protein